jgi:hypothetical protein
LNKPHIYLRLPLALAAMLAAHIVHAEAAPFAQILDVVDVPEQSSDGTAINELSGLGWDNDEKLLYAVSDNGYLHHFRIQAANGKLTQLDPVFSAAIEDTNVGMLSWDLTNAEGLHVRNGDNGKPSDSELLIAFEDGPAIGRFTPRGEFIKEIALPQPIADSNAYSDSNKRLESVSELPDIGIVTAPEVHLADEPSDMHTIFGMDGRSWHFPALQPEQSSIKALDPLPDGRILVLERTRDPQTAATQAHLRIVDIAHCDPSSLCPVAEVALSDSAAIADDYEGMTRIAPGFYVIVTDSPHGGRMALFSLRE